MQAMATAGRNGPDDHAPRPIALVDRGMDFRRASAARAADGLLVGPPFPPAAERCALIMTVPAPVAAARVLPEPCWHCWLADRLAPAVSAFGAAGIAVVVGVI
jgi:hypothetical protein